MALPPLQDLLDLLEPNATGDVTAEDMQTIVTDLYNGIVEGGGAGGGGIPVAGVLPWPDDVVPDGYLLCDGDELDRTINAELFAVIGVKYGSTSGTTFTLPDYRGLTLRCVDGGAGIDPDAASRTDRGDGTIGDAVGTKQDDEFKLHDHTNPAATIAGGSTSIYGGGNQGARATTSTGGNETRGKNVYANFIIRATTPVVSFIGGVIVPSTGSQAYAAEAQNLSALPSQVGAFLECIVDDLGYVVGDELLMGVGNGIQVVSTSADIQILQNTDIQIYNKTTQALTTVTYASWQLRVKASA